uniref:Uncharacterized protein n=1 Tax=Panagrolaimus superbus TaxID=310955 RepID=A0A914XV10_9BILA
MQPSPLRKYQDLIDDPNVADVFKTLKQSSEDESTPIEEDEEEEIENENNDAESDDSDVSAPGAITSRFVSRHSTVHSKGRKSRMTVDTD